MSSLEYFLVVVTRVRNENMMLRSFVPYYLSQGIDKIFLLDDSSTEPFDEEIQNNPKVEIRPVKNMRNGSPEWADVVHCLHYLKKRTKWVITVDCDEFIVTRRNKDKTIRQEVEDTFANVSCVKIPWVMFTRNGRKENPDDIILDTTMRWNHDNKHRHPNHSKKFNCRYDIIEVKCIWKIADYAQMHVHHPYNGKHITSDAICVDGVDGNPDGVELWRGSKYDKLRESNIERAYFTCNHYRIVSEEHARSKCNVDSKTLYTEKVEANILENALLADYPEIEDSLLKEKYEKIKTGN